MKLHINKVLKIVLIAMLICIISVVSFLLYSVFNKPRFEDQTIPQFSYTNQGSVEYQVHLKPNILYEENTLKEGEIYLSEFVDHIKANFRYEFNGDRQVELGGEYDITSVVSGTTRSGLEENDIVIWQKSFPLISKQTFTINDSSHSIKKAVQIKLDEYNEFVKLANEASKVSTNVKLQLNMNVKVNGTIDNRTIEESITTGLTVPLNTSMFEIEKNNIEKPGAIEETIQVPVPVDKNKVILYSVIIAISALGLILLIFFTKPAPKKSELELTLNKIFKKHGDRLVALSSSIDISKARKVISIDDLVRLADEINKPILYKYSEDYKEINRFFITNDDEIYVFELEGLIPEDVTEEAPADIE